jgi:hypothetical protein
MQNAVMHLSLLPQKGSVTTICLAFRDTAITSILGGLLALVPEEVRVEPRMKGN